jgi:hypothetical protein
MRGWIRAVLWPELAAMVGIRRNGEDSYSWPPTNY